MPYVDGISVYSLLWLRFNSTVTFIVYTFFECVFLFVCFVFILLSGTLYHIVFEGVVFSSHTTALLVLEIGLLMWSCEMSVRGFKSNYFCLFLKFNKKGYPQSVDRQDHNHTTPTPTKVLERVCP